MFASIIKGPYIVRDITFTVSGPMGNRMRVGHDSARVLRFEGPVGSALQFQLEDSKTLDISGPEGRALTVGGPVS